MKGFICCLLVVLLSFAGADKFDSQIRQQRHQLKKLKQELQEQRRKLKMVEVQEQGISYTLNLTQKEINTTQKYLQSLKKSEKLLSQSIEDLHLAIDSLDVKIQDQKAQMGVRVRYLYVAGKPSKAEYLLKASQEQNFQKRWTYLKKLVKYDADLVRRITELKQYRESKLSLLEEQKAEKAQLKTQKSQEALALQKKQLEHQENLERIRSNKSLFQKQLKERIQAQAKAEKLINDLVQQKIAEKRRREKLAADAARKAKAKRDQAQKVYKKGDVCWPVKGKLISKFGRQRDEYLKTYTTNLGVEIKAPEGRIVKAAAGGEVLGILLLPEKGKGVIIDHHNGYLSVYAFLKNVQVREGQEVKTCQSIASISDEGALNGPKLFFQLKKDRTNKDPMLWLQHAR